MAILQAARLFSKLWSLLASGYWTEWGWLNKELCINRWYRTWDHCVTAPGMLVGVGQFLWHVSCTWEVWRCSHNLISGPPEWLPLIQLWLHLHTSQVQLTCHRNCPTSTNIPRGCAPPHNDLMFCIICLYKVPCSVTLIQFSNH